MTRASTITLKSLLFWVAIVSTATVAAETASEAEPAPLDGTTADRIVAFGDVHGGAEELNALLRSLPVIDEAGNWIGGATRLVSLGDLLDRGPDSRAVMDLLRKLESQAAAAGGAVHLVLGNHELMNLTGDLRYVSVAEYAAFAADEDPGERARAFTRFKAELEAAAPPKSQTHTRISRPKPPEVDAQAAFDEKFPPGYFAHRAAFAADGEYGSWLLSKPQILELDGIAFVHGGLSDEFSRTSIESFNAQAGDELRALLDAGNRLVAAGRLSPWQDFVSSRATDGLALPASFSSLRASLQFDPIGPAWYRGTAGCHGLIERPRFEAVLAARGLSRIVMGHTPTNPRVIQTRFEDRAILADTGMYADYYRGRPSVAVFSDGDLRTLTLTADGRLIEMRAQPAIDLRAGDQAQWLENVAEALAGITLSSGKTTPVEANARRLEVTWHRGSKREQSARLAAYALDKLLGFGLVAPVLLVEQNGRTGVAEILPATTLSETSRATGNVYRPNYCMSVGDDASATANDFDLLLILDALMGKENRDGNSVAYDRVTWLMYMTEHEKAFPRHDRLPRYMANQNIAMPPLVQARIADLDATALSEALGQYLDERQIEAILGRRDRLLEGQTQPD